MQARGCWSRDGWIGLIMFLIGFVLWKVIIPVEVQVYSVATTISGAFLPTLSAVVMMVVGAILMVQAIRHRNSSGDAPLSSAALKRVLVVAGIVLLYFLLLQQLGYLAATIPIMIAYMWYLGERKWSTLLSVSIGTTLIVYLVFQVWMRVPLPRGEFFI